MKCAVSSPLMFPFCFPFAAAHVHHLRAPRVNPKINLEFRFSSQKMIQLDTRSTNDHQISCAIRRRSEVLSAKLLSACHRLSSSWWSTGLICVSFTRILTRTEREIENTLQQHHEQAPQNRLWLSGYFQQSSGIPAFVPTLLPDALSASMTIMPTQHRCH